jgi:hypothetical protein
MNTNMLSRIQDIVQPLIEWVKIHETEIILGMAVILISLLSFAIGYITAQEQLQEPLRLEQDSSI